MSKQKDRPDREKIARELCPDKAGWDANIRDVYVDHEKYRRQADQIIALFPDIEEAKREERERIAEQLDNIPVWRIILQWNTVKQALKGGK